MKNYLDLLYKVLTDGETRADRTGTGTKAIFGTNLEFDLRKGFPLITTKKIYTRSVIYELLWFLRGDTNIKYLRDNNVHIWDAWADEDGNVGKIYGYQWRHWGLCYSDVNPGIDQLQKAIDYIKNNSTSRRILVSAWNVGDLDQMNLPPCHIMYQFYASNDGYLDLMFYMRSVDCFLGMPFDIASYALLLSMVAQVTDRKPRYLKCTFGDTHIYRNHFSQVAEQLKREPQPLPTLQLNPDIKNIDDFRFEDITILNYNPLPAIKGEISV